LLRRRKRRCQLDELGQVLVAGDPARGPEIDQHGGAVGSDQDIAGLDVPMQDIGVVNMLQPREQRLQKSAQMLLVPGRFPREDRIQGFALLPLHDEVRGAVLLDDVSDLDDVRMRLRLGQLVERLRLADEAVQRPGEILLVIPIRRNLSGVGPMGNVPGEKLLDRDRVLEHAFLGAIDDAEGPEPQDPRDVVAADFRADGQGGMSRRAAVHR